MELNLNEIFPEPKGSVSGKDFKAIAPNLYKAVNEQYAKDHYYNIHGLHIYWRACEWAIRVTDQKAMISFSFSLHDLDWHKRDFKSPFFQEMTIEELKSFAIKSN